MIKSSIVCSSTQSSKSARRFKFQHIFLNSEASHEQLAENMTIKEIALLANTSRGTVDRVLNGRGHVKKEIADRVLAIAKEYDYTPNQLARALINSRNHYVIGVVINSIENPFFDDVLEGIGKRANYYKSYGLEVVVKKIKGYDEKEQTDAIDEMLEHGIDALAIMPLNFPGIIRKLQALKIPILTFNTDLEEIDKVAFVGCDYKNSGNLSGDLASLMLKDGGKAGVIIGSSHMEGHNLRVEGFLERIAENEKIQVASVEENYDDDAISYRATRDMIEKHKVDLIYFAAAGVSGGIKAVVESGRDIRVITVDETEFTRKCMESGVITATVTQQPLEQGAQTINILYNYLAMKKSPREKYHYTENQIKVRSSR